MLYHPRNSLGMSIFWQSKVLLIQGVGVQSKVSPEHVFVTTSSKGHKKWIGDSWKNIWPQDRENYLWFSKLFQTSIDPLCVFFLFTFQQFRTFFFN